MNLTKKQLAKMAREAGAAEARVMADGSIAFSGRSGPLAEPISFDDDGEDQYIADLPGFQDFAPQYR